MGIYNIVLETHLTEALPQCKLTLAPSVKALGSNLAIRNWLAPVPASAGDNRSEDRAGYTCNQIHIAR